MNTFTLLDNKVHLVRKAPYPSEDAIWLAAALRVQEGDKLFEAGVGNGAVSLCLLQRIEHVSITAIDCQEALVTQANANAALNHIPPEQFLATHNTLRTYSAEHLYNHAYANPPFHTIEHGYNSQDPQCMMASGTTKEGIACWVTKMLDLIEEGGSLTLLHHTKNEAAILEIFEKFSVEIIYLCTNLKKPCKRLIIRCVKKEETSPSVIKFKVNTRDQHLRQKVLYEGQSLWKYCKKSLPTA